jgi:MoaA/NifB/PqqE/SkfB family radical SAM enzyme
VVVRALASAGHPILAQLVATRRCNLACGYCNEYDHHSAPVPLAALLDRVDRLTALGTSIVELTGGEPLLHPDLDRVIARIRSRGALAGLLTNGYPLTRTRIAALNRAGLDHLQISIDNVVPDEMSQKSLSALQPKLCLLADYADFDVNINCVLGSGVQRADEARAIATRAQALGLTVTVGLLHDGTGQLAPLDDERRRAYEDLRQLSQSYYSVARHNPFQQALAEGRPNHWHCRAGARYLYVCEDGLVHWCSQQRGFPALPLSGYGVEDLARESRTEKSCAPFCTVSCVHRVAFLDRLREHPAETLQQLFDASTSRGERVPLGARALAWAFATGPPSRVVRRAAGRFVKRAAQMKS